MLMARLAEEVSMSSDQTKRQPRSVNNSTHFGHSGGHGAWLTFATLSCRWLTFKDASFVADSNPQHEQTLDLSPRGNAFALSENDGTKRI